MEITQGWINLYKPKNITSFKAINKIKRNFNLKKIGHTGTLDPLAEGILPIAIGTTTKLIPFINNKLKIYKFTVNWGSQTSTDDSEGKILFKSNFYPTLRNIKIKIKNFTGYFNQIPPKFSAIKINGERAYKLGRQNKNFNISPKCVYVRNLKVIKHEEIKTSFEIECGTGFYIRSLARDLARELKTFGHISYLERIKVGKFTKESSILLDDLLKIRQTQVGINCILPTISMLDDILAYEIVDQNDIKDLSFGRSINIDKKNFKNLQSMTIDKKLIFLSHNGDIISFGKLVGNLFKPNKILI